MACPLQQRAAVAGSLPVINEKANQQENVIVRPDIDWFPSYKVYKDRVERLAALYPNRPTTLPAGWPSQIDADRNWSGSDFKSEDDYVVKFTADDIAEIEAGLAHFRGMYSYSPLYFATQSTVTQALN